MMIIWQVVSRLDPPYLMVSTLPFRVLFFFVFGKSWHWELFSWDLEGFTSVGRREARANKRNASTAVRPVLYPRALLQPPLSFNLNRQYDHFCGRLGVTVVFFARSPKYWSYVKVSVYVFFKVNVRRFIIKANKAEIHFLV